MKSLIDTTEIRDVPTPRERVASSKRKEYLPRAGESTAAEQIALPQIVDAHALVTERMEKPKELVYGLLHQGHKLTLGGSSKAFKTWVLTDLAVSVAYGEPWLSFKTAKGRVLYVNFEIQPAFFRERIEAIESAKAIKSQSGQLDIWNLRGHAADFDTLIPRIEAGAGQAGYALISHLRY